MSGEYPEQVNARVSEETKEKLEQLEYQRSEPGEIVTKSELVREAVVRFLEEELEE